MTDQKLIQAIKHWRKDFYLKADHVGHGILLDTIIGRYIALQSENAELREENGCLQHNVAAMHATLDQQAKNCEALLAEKDKEIERLKKCRHECKIDCLLEEYNRICEKLSRVEAERDAACEAICDRCDYIPCRREACMWWRGAQGEG